jgi:nucleoside phosphorylase
LVGNRQQLKRNLIAYSASNMRRKFMAMTPQRAVIITALPIERTAVLEHLREITEEPALRGSVYRRGIFDDRSAAPWEVIVAEIGAGNPGAAAEAERVIGHYGPQVALFVGVAGAVKDLKHGDVVASTKVYLYESGKDEKGGFKARPNVELSAYDLEQRARFEAGEPTWRERIKHAGTASAPTVPDAKVAPMAAGEKVVASNRSQTYKFIREHYGDAVAVEMEGHGFLLGVRMNHPTQGIVVRSMSDLINDKTGSSDEIWQPIAARHAAAFAFQLLAKLPPASGGTNILATAEDVKKVRAQSDASLNALSRVASIRIGDAEVHVPRRSIEALGGAIKSENLVLVGEPGAGKSIGLYSLARLLTQEGGEVVVVDVQRVQAESAGQLRNELNLSQNLLDVLKAWPGDKPAYLLIDALDAARSESMARTFFDLLSALLSEPNSRWNVVVSVRKFDLRYNEELKRLFRGTPPTEFVDPEFAGLRHVNLPVLDDSELNLVAQRLPPIQSLIAAANDDLQSLLKVPFNLRLAAELLDAGTRLTDLTHIRTQIQLLDQYWRARVIGNDARGDARESVAFAAATQMANSRSLTIARSVISKDPGASEALHGLLGANVLAEWSAPDVTVPDRYTLTFSHNILFDYAAALALFGSSTAALLKQLAATPDLVLAIRPSAVFQFQRIWLATNDHRDFWRSVLDAIEVSDLPRICQLIGPSVAVDFARDISDFEGLFAALEGSNSRDREAAEEAVRHIAGALLAKNTPLTGPSAGPWCAWMERVSLSVTIQTAGSLRVLLWRCLENA